MLHGVPGAGQVWAPRTHQGPPEFVHLKLRIQTYKRFSRSWIPAASAAVAETRAASVPHPGLRSPSRPPPQHLPAPSTPAPGPKLPLPPLSFPFFSLNVGRAAVKNPPTLVSEISKPERLLGPRPSLFCLSTCHSSPRPCPLLSRCSRESASLTEPLERDGDRPKYTV